MTEFGARAHIAARIKQHGPIPFSEYMHLALYAPGLGYYSGGAHKFGKDGDFVTAPEISPLFSKCVAHQCQQVLAHYSDGVILELGAGTGVMALEILRELARLECLPKTYYILEVSAELQQRQQTCIREAAPELFDRVQWLTRLPEPPISGIILGNEVVDAMPVEKFLIQEGNVNAFFVDWQNDQFVWKVGEASSELQRRVKALDICLSDGYESEINLALPAWIASLADTLAEGLILLIDYGFPRHEYYHPDRDMGTLMCHYQHRAHPDPLINVGLQDITTHVDFTSIADAAVQNQLEVSGFVNQASFLIAAGLMQMLPGPDHPDAFALNQQVKQLTLPSEMGELFKAIALTKTFDEPLLGFHLFDQRHRL